MTLVVCVAVLGLLLLQAYLLANHVIELPAHRHKRRGAAATEWWSDLSSQSAQGSSSQQHLVDDAHFYSHLLPSMRRYCSNPTANGANDDELRKRSTLSSLSTIPDDVAPTVHITSSVLYGAQRGDDMLTLSYEHLPTITCMAESDEYWFDDDDDFFRDSRQRIPSGGLRPGAYAGENRTPASFGVYFDAHSTQKITVRPLSHRTVTKDGGATAVTLKRATALLLLDPEAAYSIYHLVADTMVALLLWMDAIPWPNPWLFGARAGESEHDALGRLALAVVVRRDEGHTELRRPCAACVRTTNVLTLPPIRAVATDRQGRPRAAMTLPDFVTATTTTTANVAPSGAGAAQSAVRSHLQCYCDTLFVPRNVLPLDALDARRRGYSILRDRLSRFVAEPPSLALPLAPVASVPKLLFLQRATSRRIGDQDAIVSLARRLGFHVRVEEGIERLSTEEQLLLFRDEADVVLMTHGMAAGWTPIMAAVDPTAKKTATSVSPPACRTVVELQHRVRDFPREFRFAELIARDNGLAHILVRATRAEFGGSVRNAEEAERYLMDADIPIQVAMTHPAFFDQTAFYNISEIESALGVAWRRWRSHCSSEERSTRSL